MSARLSGFDYSLPYYYMVTLKRLDGLAPFSAIGEGGVVVENEITKSFRTVIGNFHRQWFVVEPIWCYAIMPDHLHLLIKLAPGEKKMALGSIVFQLMKALAKAYWESRPSPAQTELGGAFSPAQMELGGAEQGTAEGPVLLKPAPSGLVPSGLALAKGGGGERAALGV